MTSVGQEQLNCIIEYMSMLHFQASHHLSTCEYAFITGSGPFCGPAPLPAALRPGSVQARTEWHAWPQWCWVRWNQCAGAGGEHRHWRGSWRQWGFSEGSRVAGEGWTTCTLPQTTAICIVLCTRLKALYTFVSTQDWGARTEVMCTYVLFPV